MARLRPRHRLTRSRGGRAVVEILVSHLSAQNAERWGTLLPGEGEIEWTGVLVLILLRTVDAKPAAPTGFELLESNHFAQYICQRLPTPQLR